MSLTCENKWKKSTKKNCDDRSCHNSHLTKYFIDMNYISRKLPFSTTSLLINVIFNYIFYYNIFNIERIIWGYQVSWIVYSFGV
jgi:hypothetical protein